MELRHVIGINLKRRPERKCLWLGALQSRFVPMSKVEIFEAHDGRLYESSFDVIEAAQAEFPFFHDIVSSFRPPQLCVGWSFLSVFKQIASFPEDCAVLLMLDDVILQKDWEYLTEVTQKLGEIGNFKLLQIWSFFHKELSKYREYFPVPVESIPGVGYGASYGDNAMIISPAGARLLLGWAEADFETFNVVVENYFWRYFQNHDFIEGIYCVINNNWVDSTFYGDFIDIPISDM